MASTYQNNKVPGSLLGGCHLGYSSCNVNKRLVFYAKIGKPYLTKWAFRLKTKKKKGKTLGFHNPTAPTRFVNNLPVKNTKYSVFLNFGSLDLVISVCSRFLDISHTEWRIQSRQLIFNTNCPPGAEIRSGCSVNFRVPFWRLQLNVQ